MSGACELNYKTATRPLSTLEPTMYADQCAQPCKVQTPCRKQVKICEPVCPPVLATCAPVVECVDPCATNGRNWGWWSVILVFIIVFIISWFLLYSLKPNFVLNTDANGNVVTPVTVNGGRVVVFSIIIALVVCLLLWAFRNSFKY
jgi:predicted secreted protein